MNHPQWHGERQFLKKCPGVLASWDVAFHLSERRMQWEVVRTEEERKAQGSVVTCSSSRKCCLYTGGCRVPVKHRLNSKSSLLHPSPTTTVSVELEQTVFRVAGWVWPKGSELHSQQEWRAMLLTPESAWFWVKDSEL